MSSNSGIADHSCSGTAPVGKTAWGDAAAAVGVFAFGVAICLYYGRIGLFPLDQSIVFDGAWRMHRDGQIPYRDFFTPTNSVPIVIQAGLFSLLGPTWFAYCLHSAVVNGLFGVVCLLLLRGTGLTLVPATIFSVLSTVVMYVPIGTPFGDQHAMFFTTLTLAASLLAIATPRLGPQCLLWLALPLLMALAIFSKQNPGLHSIPLGLAPLLFTGPRKAVLGAACIVVGTALTLAGIWCLGRMFQIDADQFLYFFWQLPFGTGAKRLTKVPSLTRAVFGCQLASLPMALLGLVPLLAAGLRCDAAPGFIPGWVARSLQSLIGLFFAVLIPLTCCDLLNTRLKIVVNGAFFLVAASFCAAASAWLATSRRPLAKAVGARAASHLPAILVGVALLLLDIVYSITTNNNAQNCFPHSFVAAGLLYQVACGVAPLLVRAAGPRPRLVPALLIAFCLADAALWNQRFNATRYANEFFKGPPRPLPGSVLTPRFSFMQYDIPKWHSIVTDGSGRDAYVEAVEFLRANPGNFVWLGDFTVAYAIADRPSFAPWLWFHGGLAIPEPGTPQFEGIETTLIDRMRQHDCTYVVIESPQTFMKMRLSDFPQLTDYIRRNEKERLRFETIEIIRVR